MPYGKRNGWGTRGGEYLGWLTGRKKDYLQPFPRDPHPFLLFPTVYNLLQVDFFSLSLSLLPPPPFAIYSLYRYSTLIPSQT